MSRYGSSGASYAMYGWGIPLSWAILSVPRPPVPMALSSLRAKVQWSPFSPPVLLRWVTHRNLFLEKSFLVHTLLLILFSKGCCFPRKCPPRQKAGPPEMRCTLQGPFYVRKRKLSFSWGYILKQKEKQGENWSCLGFCVFSYFRNTWKETLREKQWISNDNSNPFIQN